jgi:hypothetical protein
MGHCPARRGVGTEEALLSVLVLEFSWTFSTPKELAEQPIVANLCSDFSEKRCHLPSRVGENPSVPKTGWRRDQPGRLLRQSHFLQQFAVTFV